MTRPTTPQKLLVGRMSGKALLQRREICEELFHGQCVSLACMNAAEADKAYNALVEHIGKDKDLLIESCIKIGRTISISTKSGRTATVRVTCPRAPGA